MILNKIKFPVATSLSIVLCQILWIASIVGAQNILITKNIICEEGRYLKSSDTFTIPENMVVQGCEVYYDADLPGDSPLDNESTDYTYEFIKQQGDVNFLGSADTSSNYFRSDWYGENIIKVTAADGSGNSVQVEDTVFVNFASRRVVGGEAENLPSDFLADIDRNAIHDIQATEKGMAFLPADHSRGDATADEIINGFFQTTEPRLLLGQSGVLVQTTQVRRIGPNDAPPGQGILVSRSLDFGNSWQNELLLVQHDDDLWGYTALVEIEDKIYLYVSAGHPSHQGNNLVDRGLYYFVSDDDGETWSEKIRHDDLSDDLGFTSSLIPRGPSPNRNILKVPGLTLDGQVAANGIGLLMSTYANGYLWASIDNGVQWVKVADAAEYAIAETNGVGVPVYLENELSWAVLDNPEGDIYIVARRQASTGFKNEFVISKHMVSGNLGLTVKNTFNQSLENFLAMRCHHGLKNIQMGPYKSRLMFVYQGASTRHHIRLAISKEPVTGSVTSDMYDEVDVMRTVAWGYPDIEYVPANLTYTQGMGRDAIVLIGESEPIHKETYQIIDLKPDGRGVDERFTTTMYMLSMEYFYALQGKELPISIEPSTKKVSKPFAIKGALLVLPDETVEVKVFDIKGREIRKLWHGNHRNALDISQLKSGLYILWVESQKKAHSFYVQ